ncbi:hypothetical protein Barb6XT_02692 [Bacteroidales bacterium Barb6XT]|nr:hypothetical protein Barb6XT_02692 [Bacteroidales bacterium Barb6XT]
MGFIRQKMNMPARVLIISKQEILKGGIFTVTLWMLIIQEIEEPIMIIPNHQTEHW